MTFFAPQAPYDILEPLHQLSLKFQACLIHPFDVPGMVEIAVSILKDCYTGGMFINGPVTERFLNEVESNTYNRNWKDLINIDGITANKKIKIKTKHLVLLLIDKMNKRLAGQCDDLLNDLKIFIPQKKFVDFKTTECVNFGKYQILCLAERYCHLEIDKNLVITKWEHFNVISQHYMLFPTANKIFCEDDWIDSRPICAIQPDIYRNLNQIAQILLTTNCQNAVVERGFSVAHQIKTKVQARINVRTSDALIHLQLNMDDYKTINLDGAYQKWFGNSQQGPYNIGQQRKMVQNKNETDDDAYHFEDF